MGRTPDRRAGKLREDDSIVLTDVAVDPVEVGEINYNAGDFRMRDASGVFNPRTGGGISESDHESLDTLTHLIAESNFTEVTRSSGQISNVTVWTNSGKTTKIREMQITRSSGQITQVVKIQYDGAGVAITGQTITTTVNRSSGQIVSFDDLET